MKQSSHLKQILGLLGFGYSKEKLEKRVGEILSDVRCVAKIEESNRLKGKIQRRSEAVLREERWTRNVDGVDVESEWPEHGELVVTVYSNEGGVKNKSEIRVRPTHYGVEIRGDSPVFADKEASNCVKVVALARNEYHEIYGNEMDDE